MWRAVVFWAGLSLGFAACGGGEAEPPATPAATSCPYEDTEADRVKFAIPPPSLCVQWPETDWSKHTVPFGEIVRGCAAPDCIPALDAQGAVTIPAAGKGVARFAPVAAVGYPERFPVAVLEQGGEVRGYPLHILVPHEVVNDELGGVAVAVTFCPLCNTAIAFDRSVAGDRLDFSVSGNLRNSDLIMYDRQTKSWWQQATGEAIVGIMAGEKLRALPLRVVSMGEFAGAYPAATVLTEETGWPIGYGSTSFIGYDRGVPTRFNGSADSRLPALERVVGIDGGGAPVAVPFARLAQTHVAMLGEGETRIAVFWAPGVASVLDAQEISGARDVGAAVAFEAVAGDGRPLDFEAAGDGRFRDHQTQSTWEITGRAVEGPLAGEQLRPVVHTSAFWFAWAAFHPKTAIWG